MAPCGLLGLLQVTLSDGTIQLLPTSKQWQTSKDGSNWLPAEELGSFGIAPWGSSNPLLFMMMRPGINHR